MDNIDAAKAAHLLREIQEILWPDGDIDRQWSPDTLDEIAHAMIRDGWCPSEVREE
jgi:hypothetical protein